MVKAILASGFRIPLFFLWDIKGAALSWLVASRLGVI
jgi:hypothetical protein